MNDITLEIISFDIVPVASEYQEIHPYSAMNIDSVEINISLIMMRELPIFKQAAHEFMSKIWLSAIPDTQNTR